jgi:hypothetical protein
MNWHPVGFDGWYSELTAREQDIWFAEALADPKDGIILASVLKTPIVWRKPQVVEIRKEQKNASHPY